MSPKQLTILIDTIVIIITSFILFTLFLGSYHFLTPDEGRYLEVAREMVHSGNYITPHLDGTVFLDKPILFYWLEAALIKMLGVHEWSTRLLPVSFATLGCLFNYFAGVKLFSRRTGLLAAYLLMSSLIYFFTAHYANMDLMVAVLITGSLYASIIGLKATRTAKQRSYYLWGAYVLAAFAFLTKGLIGIVFPMMIIGVWLFIQRDWQVLLKLRIISGFTIILAITLPWLITITYYNPDFLHYFFITQQFSRYTTQHFNEHKPFYFYMIVILAGLVPWVLFLIQSLYYQINQACRQTGTQQSIRRYLLLWPLLITIFFSIPDSKLIGYILSAIPPLPLLIANYLGEKSPHLAHSREFKLTIGIGIILGLIMAAILLGLAYTSTLGPTQANVLIGLIAIIIVAGCLSLGFFAFFKTQLNASLATLFVSALAIYMIYISHVSVFKPTTIKPLAQTIKHYYQPSNRIISYKDYFQSLPLYLGQRVDVVYDWDNPALKQHDNWRTQLAEGIIHNHYHQPHLINNPQFLNLWQQQKVFVVVKQKRWSALKANIQQHTQRAYHVIQKHQNILLITNFEIDHTKS